MTKETLRKAVETEKTAPRRDRALSVRLSAAEHRLLFKVAKREGLLPSTLARVLVVAGLAELAAERGRL